MTESASHFSESSQPAYLNYNSEEDDTEGEEYIHLPKVEEDGSVIVKVEQQESIANRLSRRGVNYDYVKGHIHEETSDVDNTSRRAKQLQYERVEMDQEFEVKSEFSSQVTLENMTPYLRRENFLQSYKAFMLYMDNLLRTDMQYILPRVCESEVPNHNNNPAAASQKRYNKMQIISDQLIAAFSSRGIQYENQIYRYLLAKSMSSPLLQQYGQLIFAQYLKDPETYQAFLREYNYQKGKINYFDPDFTGEVWLELCKEDKIGIHMRLQGFKDKLYLRVMMVMYKKVLRLVFILEMIFKRIFGNSGRSVHFEIEFTFRYAHNQMNKMPMHHPTYFILGKNIEIHFLYLKNEIYAAHPNFLKKEEDVVYNDGAQ